MKRCCALLNNNNFFFCALATFSSFRFHFALAFSPLCLTAIISFYPLALCFFSFFFSPFQVHFVRSFSAFRVSKWVCECVCVVIFSHLFSIPDNILVCKPPHRFWAFIHVYSFQIAFFLLLLLLFVRLFYFFSFIFGCCFVLFLLLQTNYYISALSHLFCDCEIPIVSYTIVRRRQFLDTLIIILLCNRRATTTHTHTRTLTSVTHARMNTKKHYNSIHQIYFNDSISFPM